ncbi:MAG TPA: alpha/beta fold hydrolase [Mycobacterium sp.]|uniref:alpha/beta hydrolase n=1 Tax=Mycobacterium sp. TaxID=1785 RepID=UPI002D7563EB|nr:alpha/beta fold hydrolase [Mycobacterium sp.]HZU47748.1 alpha/beta fold hydrolase [Mycobacterium sp.]
MSSSRIKVHFSSGDTRCAAWHYPGRNRACVIMAGGLGVTKEPGTDRFAKVFNDAGYTVLAFDYRHLGESGGMPRQLVRIGEQLADWQAAITFAATLPDVDPTKLTIWGFSLSGGHVFSIAARNPGLAAAIAHAPLADGPASAPNAFRHMTPFALTRLTARALADTVSTAVGREPVLVPLAGPRGTVASLTTPDSLNSGPALNPGNRYPEWRQAVNARAALEIGLQRPGRHASRIRCPLLVVAYQNDGVAPPKPAIRAAHRAPRGELALLPGGHYEAFLTGHQQAAETLLSFLDRHVAVSPQGSMAR